MAKQTSPVRLAGRKSAGKQNAKSKPRSKMDSNKQIKIQKALYEIADAASAVTDMQAFYAALHRIVGKLMYARNFYVSLYDPDTQMLSSPYFADEAGDVPPPPSKLEKYSKSLRAHVLREGKTLHISGEEIEEGRRRGRFTPMGTPAIDWVGVPLKSSGRVVGMLTVQSYQKGVRFEKQDVQLLEFVAQHIAVALTRAQAIGETRQQNAELAIINSVQAALAAQLDIHGIYEVVGDKIREIFHNIDVSIRILDTKANLLRYQYVVENGQRIQIEPFPIPDRGFGPHVLRTRESLMINENMAQEIEKFGSGIVPGTLSSKSLIMVPLISGNEARGLVTLNDVAHEHAFNDSDVRLLETLASAMSIALENVRLFSETQRLLQETEHRAQELATVNTVSTALAGELDLNTLIELVGEHIRSVFKADIAFVALLDKEKGIINFPYQYGEQNDSIQLGEGLTSRIIQSGKPLLINQDMDRQREQLGVTLIGKRARSFLGVPIFAGAESIGVVSVQYSEKEVFFTEDDQRMLSTIASNVAIALQNARLFNETQDAFLAEQQAHEQAETLRSVAQGLNRSLSLKDVFDLVLIEIQKVIPYDSAGIYQVHSNRRVFVTGRGFANLESLVGVGFEFNQQDDEIGYVISQSLQPLILEDASVQYPQYFNAGPHSVTKIRSYMAVPIVLNQKLIGMITLDREDPGFYTDQHAVQAMAFAAQAATAINNARLFDETQRLLKETEQRAAELQVINRVQEGLASKLDYHAIVDLVGDTIRDIFHTQSLSIGRYDHANQMVDYSYVVQKGQRTYYDPMVFSGIAHHLISTRQMLMVNENVKQKMDELGSHWGDIEIPKTLIYVPLIAGETVTGVVAIYDFERESAFSDSDIRLLQTLSNSMSVALENARLWEQEKLYRKALQRELEIGREIQAGFLPETLPHVEGWEIAASLMSAREVAGDFYDAFELPDGTIGLVIADVCDKGVGAALFMTLFRSLIRVISNQEYFEHAGRNTTEQSIAERLKHTLNLTNNYIAETHEKSGMFATVFFGILDPRNGKLIYINGGHEPPVIFRSGCVREILDKSSPAVGIFPNYSFITNETMMREGDIFFAYTDGASDCIDPHGKFFGRERLLNVSQRGVKSADELVKCLESELTQYLKGANQFDDITLMAVRRVG